MVMVLGVMHNRYPYLPFGASTYHSRYGREGLPTQNDSGLGIVSDTVVVFFQGQAEGSFSYAMV